MTIPSASQRQPVPGFTIVELMVSLAVAAVLFGMALPAFDQFVEQRRMTTRVNDMVLAIGYARSEAARLGTLVSVRAHAPSGGNEWGGGYCVVQGNAAGDCSGTVLRGFPAIDAADATLNSKGTGFDGQAVLSFNQRGLLTLGSAGTIELCSADASIDPGRVINVSFIGRTDVNDLECHP